MRHHTFSKRDEDALALDKATPLVARHWVQLWHPMSQSASAMQLSTCKYSDLHPQACRVRS